MKNCVGDGGKKKGQGTFLKHFVNYWQNKFEMNDCIPLVVKIYKVVIEM